MIPVTAGTASRLAAGVRFVAVSVALALPLAAAAEVRAVPDGDNLCHLELEGAPRSQIRLEGTTTIHRWACDGKELEARMAVEASLDQVHQLLAAVESQLASGPIENGLDLPRIPPPTFELVIPVDALDCGSRPMERDLHEALKSDVHPTIEYRFQTLQKASLEPREEEGPRRYELEVTGTLKLAGVSREIRSTAWAEAQGAKGFHLQGELHLKMSQFEITPPTALFGLIRARDDLVVRYDLYLEAASVQEALRYAEGQRNGQPRQPR